MNLETNDSYWPYYVALSLTRDCLHFHAERCVAVILSGHVAQVTLLLVTSQRLLLHLAMPFFLGLCQESEKSINVEHMIFR